MQCCSTTASASAVLITPAIQIADTNDAIAVRIADAQRQIEPPRLTADTGLLLAGLYNYSGIQFDTASNRYALSFCTATMPTQPTRPTGRATTSSRS